MRHERLWRGNTVTEHLQLAQMHGARWAVTERWPRDPFPDVRAASDRHRDAHGAGCLVYPITSGPPLGVLAATVGSCRILEVGFGLGYSALRLAWFEPGRPCGNRGTGPHPCRARSGKLPAAGGEGMEVLVGDGLQVLAGLEGPYDVIFSEWRPRRLCLAARSPPAPTQAGRAADQRQPLPRPIGFQAARSRGYGQVPRRRHRSTSAAPDQHPGNTAYDA